MSTDSSSANTRRRRLKTMPVPSERTQFVWSLDNEELAGLTRAQQVMLITKTRAWREIVVPKCQALPKRGKRGPYRTYTPEQLEICFLYGMACGEHVPERVHELLVLDRERYVREILGLPEREKLKHQWRAGGIPAARTLRRHKERVGDDWRAELWDQVYQQLLDLVLDHESFHETMRQLYMDGVSLFTHYTAPFYKPSGEVSNEPKFEVRNGRKRRVSGYTAEDAGYRGTNDELNHPAGHGWHTVVVTDPNGIPVAYAIDKVNRSEKILAQRALNFYGERVMPKLTRENPGDLSVLTADAGFNSPHVKRRAHELGLAPNIHKLAGWKSKAYHKLSTPEKLAAAEKDLQAMKGERGSAAAAAELATEIKAAKEVQAAKASWRPIEHYRNWRVNDLRQIACVCGQGKVSKRAFRDDRGYAVMAIEGRCDDCGACTVQAGRWRRADNAAPWTGAKDGGSWYVQALAGDDPGKTDWAFGNYLTFTEPETKAYSGKRFGRGEGFNSALRSRFGFGREKRSWHRSMAATQAHLTQSFCLMLTLALEHRGALGTDADVLPFAPQTTAPPGEQAQAA
jgi:hypothetical protein